MRPQLRASKGIGRGSESVVRRLGVDRLPHGYTNFTRRLPGGVIEKTYDGPARWDNARREEACLVGVASHRWVPPLVASDQSIPRLLIGDVAGTHGQELIDAGHARQVLRLTGEALRELHGIDPATVPGLEGSGTVIVHGDFGPQNMLFDLTQDCVTAVIDWESAHIGTPVEDVAWAEWIVRMHHPDAIDALDALLEGAASSFDWHDRHIAMLEQVRRVLRYCETSGFEQSAADWRALLATTESWP